MMTQIIAHRGSKSNRPENTLASFAEAIRVGTDGIELDVHRTRDGHLVVIHDESVDRTTNGSGLVRKLTLEQIRSLDAGSWFHPQYFRERISTLGEVIDFLEEKGFQGLLNIEIKTDKYPYPKIEKQIARLMHRKKVSFSYMYSSFNLFSLYLMRKHDPGIELAYLMKDQSFHLWLAGKSPFIGAVHPHRSLFLGKKRDLSLLKPLRLWTVNKTSDMKKAIKGGVQAIITDKPEEALLVKREVEENH